jgi:prolipoprotein diacylglyceryltransferase
MKKFYNIKNFFDPHHAFHACGCLGLTLSIMLTITISAYSGIALFIIVAIILLSVMTFLGAAFLTKIIAGRETIVYYHHEIVILLAIAGFLKILHQPVLPYLDVTILGIGVFLFCGRIGCFMAGCCHGKPHNWGVCYTEEHKKAGFTPYLAGVKLFPVQLLESLVVLFTVMAGTVLVLGSTYQQGDVLTWYIIAYGAARFFLEFLRGDPDRRYFSMFSEAQWTSLVLTGLTVWAELSGMLPCHAWHLWVVAYLLLTTLIFFLIEHFPIANKYRLIHPYHIKEVAEAISITAGSNVPVSCTSIGIQISAGKSITETGFVYHYTLSRKNKKMNEKDALILSRLILRLGHFSSMYEVIKGNRSVFHLVIHA